MATRQEFEGSIGEGVFCFILHVLHQSEARHTRALTGFICGPHIVYMYILRISCPIHQGNRERDHEEDKGQDEQVMSRFHDDPGKK